MVLIRGSNLYENQGQKIIVSDIKQILNDSPTGTKSSPTKKSEATRCLSSLRKDCEIGLLGGNIKFSSKIAREKVIHNAEKTKLVQENTLNPSIFEKSQEVDPFRDHKTVLEAHSDSINQKKKPRTEFLHQDSLQRKMNRLENPSQISSIEKHLIKNENRQDDSVALKGSKYSEKGDQQGSNSTTKSKKCNSGICTMNEGSKIKFSEESTTKKIKNAHFTENNLKITSSSKLNGIPVNLSEKDLNSDSIDKKPNLRFFDQSKDVKSVSKPFDAQQVPYRAKKYNEKQFTGGAATKKIEKPIEREKQECLEFTKYDKNDFRTLQTHNSPEKQVNPEKSFKTSKTSRKKVLIRSDTQNIPKKNHQLLSKGKILGFVILLINILVKTYKIEKGSSVVWDEAHFGKFGSKYLRQEFYFDVHPPLGKMLTALSGYLFNQDKDFKFESATPYPDSMDYVGMRRFHAVIGSLVALFAYGILRELGRSKSYSFTFSMFFVFENGFTCISRLILLDSHLLLFTSATIYTFTKAFMDIHVRNCSTLEELYDLTLVGICLGSVLSIKWIGCLTTALVGLFVIVELYYLLMSQKPIALFLKKFAIRFLCLIVVPVALYVLFFVIHFAICSHSTPDEAHMSSLFQATLKNNTLYNSRKYVSFGSVISVKSSQTGGGNLHSHPSTYPNTNSRQVTTYFHKDENNHWAFQKVIEDGESVDILRDGDEIVLLHVPTKGYLAHDDFPAYVGKGSRVFNNDGTLTRNCVFVIEIDHDVLKLEKNVKTVTTRFRLRAQTNNMYLAISGKNYPSWGFGQGEVVLVHEKGPNTLWNIEDNAVKPGENAEVYKELQNSSSRFLQHIFELNVAMYNTNKALIQDPNLEPVRIVSRPKEWFFLKRGLRMNSWDDKNTKFYMFGNPITWYLSGVSILAVPFLVFRVFIQKKSHKHREKEHILFFYAYVCFGGWALHYLPFFFIGRVLYFHHYYPALFFAIFGIDFAIQIMKRLKKYIKFVVLVVIAIYAFFSPLTYGIQGNSQDLKYRQWRKTWDFK